MRLQITRDNKDTSVWHAWYAWRPVIAFDDAGHRYIVWRENVRRRLAGTNDYFFYEYRVR